MSWQNLLVEFLLVAAGAIVSSDGGVLDETTLQPTSLSQRVVFPQSPSAPNHQTTDFPYSRSEASATRTDHRVTQVTNQTTNLMAALPEKAVMMTAESISSADQIISHAQAESTDASSVTHENPTRTIIGQSRIHKLVKTTAASAMTAVTSELLHDQAGVHTATRTAARVQWTTSKPTPSNGQKTTAPATPAIAGNTNKSVAETMDDHTTPVANRTTTQRANTTAQGNTTSVHARSKSTASTPTIPAGPTLMPKPSQAAIGAYSVSNGTADCIKALFGLTLTVKNRKTKTIEYLNIDPNVTQTTGICGNWLATLNISFQGGFIRFTFSKNGDMYYVSVTEASLTVPSEGLDYRGLKTDPLFSTSVGSCFKCRSQQTMNLASNFQLLVVDSQLQAFAIVGDQFGKEEECALDRNRKVIPVTVGLSLAGLFVIVLVTCMINRRKPNRRYQRI